MTDTNSTSKRSPTALGAAACLMLTRVSIAGWVVASALFVCTSVAEQRAPHLNSVTKDVLALVRFPWFYAFGFALLGVGLIAGLVLIRLTVPHRGLVVFVVLVLVALVGMSIDYAMIYRPLRAMITPPGTARPSDYTNYHTASRRINEFGLALSAAAAFLICWRR